MGNNSQNYISLSEATKFCNYSQEYLSLRARQGKLKAVKFGRNWITKKEWLDEYLGRAQNIEIIETPKLSLKFPEIPIEISWKLRFGFLVILVFALLLNNIVFGVDNFKNVYPVAKDFCYGVYQDLDFAATKIGENTDLAVKEIFDLTKNIFTLATEGAEITFQGLNTTISTNVENILHSSQEMATVSVPAVFGLMTENLKELNQWLPRQTFEVGQKIVQGYTTANNFVEQKLSVLFKKYLVANDFVEQKIVSGLNRVLTQFKRISEFVSRPFRPKTIIVEKLPPEAEKKMSDLEEKVKELEEKIPEKIVKEVEVEKITKIEPIKEVTKEVVKIEDKELALIKSQITNLEQEMTKRLYAPGGVVSQAIYVTQPVASPRIYQENSDIVLQALGTGNVVLTAGTGVQISGQQVVIDSTSVLNPLIYLADHTKIAGSLTVGTGTLFIDTLGNLTTTGNIQTTSGGNLTVAGNLVVTGTQTFSGVMTLAVDSTNPGLTITQAGTGQLVNFSKSGGGSFIIDGSGNITANGTLTLNDSAGTWKMGVTDGKLEYNGALTIASGGTGDLILDSASGKIQAADGDTFYTEGGHPIRAAGEQILRSSVPIFRYSMPSQTGSITFIRISKHFDNTSDISLPAALTGTTRVYRLVINYADDILAADFSNWRVVDAAGATVYDTFNLPGRAMTSFTEGQPYLTDVVSIPDSDWQLEAKVPLGKTIRIFNIFLIAYDQVM